MKKIDWYILKKYLGTFFFIIVLLNCITVMIDISEKIDTFLEPELTWKIIVFDYYIFFIPFITAILAPFFALIAVIFFTSQMADRSEIIAILNSGTSFYRMLFPYFVGATIIASSLYVANNYVLPNANRHRVAFENKYINKYASSMSYNFHRQIEPGVFIYVEGYRPSEADGSNFSIDHFKNGELQYKLRAEKIKWDSIHKIWHLTNFYSRKIALPRDEIKEGVSLDTSFSFTPENFTFNDNVKEEMTTPELKKYIQKMYKQGMSFIEFYEVEQHRRTAIPFSVFIMTLIGVSVASRKVRGGLGWHLVMGIGLSATYEIIMKFSVTFSTNATLPPFIGVWIPNVIYGFIALYMIWRAPK